MEKKILNQSTLKEVLILFLLIPIFSFAQEDGIWDFPVKPGAVEWKTFLNNAEKVQACQVPATTLSSIPTGELVQICLNYPLLPDIFAFNNLQDGFNKFENDFNGFGELLRRDDALEELVKEYKSIDPAAIPQNGTILEKGNYVLRTSFLELYISHPSIIKKINFEEKKEIVKDLLLKKEKKGNRPSWYQTTGMQTSYFAIVNLVQSEPKKFKPDFDVSKVSAYIYSGILAEADITEQIDKAANKYIERN
ncbi:MAG: hypothetical protein K9H26_10155 [Prolixibacteraceae bacterium]|nr:hypothetical protein [Prolixibacteraceae bacterium]